MCRGCVRGDAIKSRTSWEVDVDNAFYVNAADDDYNKQFINGFTEQDWADAWADGDEFFSQYTSVQEDINRRYNTYAKGINKYDNTHMYVFILPENKTRQQGQLGDMFSETRFSGVHDAKTGRTENRWSN